MREQTSEADAALLSDRGEALCRSIETLPFPVIAVLTGPALGGGAELAMACDVRLAEKQARIGFVQTRMGVTPAWGTTARLVGAVGVQRASKLLLFGAIYDAEHALQMGVVDEIVETDQGLFAARALAEQAMRGSPMAIAFTKQLLAHSQAALYAAVRPTERDAFIATWSSADHREAVDAYFEKRRPTFRPRSK